MTKSRGHHLITAATCFACAFLAQPASAYLDAGFVHVPGANGGWSGGEYRNWIRTEGHYWKRLDIGRFTGERNRTKPMFFSGPAAVASGGDTLVVSVSKQGQSWARLLAVCKKGGTLPQITFAESAPVVRPGSEVGERPAAIPPWFEYRLKNVEIGCPVVPGATEQAFTFKFADIEWLNYKGPAAGVPISLRPATLPPRTASGKTKSFVLSWLGVSADADPAPCPTMNEKPTVDDYLAFFTGSDAVKARANLDARKGALDYAGGTVSRRGPEFLNVCQIPGIVPAPIHRLPLTRIANGLDLDRDNGARISRPDVPLYRNYTSPDGRKGVDNQLYTATACVAGLSGRKGFIDQYGNEEMRNGLLSILLTISGIDDDRDDDSVDITILYSKDPMAKTASGKDVLADYSFRIAKDPVLSYYFRRLSGRILNGVIETDPVDRLDITRGYGGGSEIYSARLRLETLSDGSLKGVMGGYISWRGFMMGAGNSQNEHLSGFMCPGLYQTLKNAADGLKNPETGEFDGISASYDLEGRPAFIPASELARY